MLPNFALAKPIFHGLAFQKRLTKEIPERGPAAGRESEAGKFERGGAGPGSGSGSSMKSYPSGVMQNYSTPNMPPDLRPVPETSWRRFSDLVDAQAGLDMIRQVVPNAQMKDATEGQYAQYVYFDPKSSIRCRLVYGKIGELAILEYPSDIFDRSHIPQPFVDSYSAGQTPVLKCRAVAPELGELYWAAP